MPTTRLDSSLYKCVWDSCFQKYKREKMSAVIYLLLSNQYLVTYIPKQEYNYFPDDQPHWQKKKKSLKKTGKSSAAFF